MRICFFQIALLRNMKQQCVQPDKEQGCQLFSLHLTLFVTLGPLWIFCIKHGYLKRFCDVADGRQWNPYSGIRNRAKCCHVWIRYLSKCGMKPSSRYPKFWDRSNNSILGDSPISNFLGMGMVISCMWALTVAITVFGKCYNGINICKACSLTIAEHLRHFSGIFGHTALFGEKEQQTGWAVHLGHQLTIDSLRHLHWCGWCAPCNTWIVSCHTKQWVFELEQLWILQLVNPFLIPHEAVSVWAGAAVNPSAGKSIHILSSSSFSGLPPSGHPLVCGHGYQLHVGLDSCNYRFWQMLQRHQHLQGLFAHNRRTSATLFRYLRTHSPFWRKRAADRLGSSSGTSVDNIYIYIV